MQKIRQIIDTQQENGFTLVEIIAVLAILAILASLSMPRFIDLGDNAKQKVLLTALSDLNAQQSLLWYKMKYSNEGWIDDETLFSQLDTDLGSDYKWAPKATSTGGNLHFKDQKLKLMRNPSTAISSGKWTIE
jgi:prepilin-type N-terminal cleavage/methylation domain-containing protein